MIVTTTRRIGVADVTPAFHMKRGALCRLLQDAAVNHIDVAGRMRNGRERDDSARRFFQ